MSKFSDFESKFNNQTRKYQITLQQYHIDTGEIKHSKYGHLLTKEELDEEMVKINKRMDNYNGSNIQNIGCSVETVSVENMELEGNIEIEDTHEYTDILIGGTSLIDIVRHSYEGLRVNVKIEVIKENETIN